jgi:hypothetical protein
MLSNYDFNFNVAGVLAAQTWIQIASHLDCVNRYKVNLFIELGMYMGGTLPHLIPNLILNPAFSYIGFEILPSAVKPSLLEFSRTNSRCEIILEDLFSDKNVTYIKNRIAALPNPVYIFCDGGNKPKELMTFSSFMRVGDIISVHDYTADQTGEIKNADVEWMNENFRFINPKWNRDEIGLLTFIKVK